MASPGGRETATRGIVTRMSVAVVDQVKVPVPSTLTWPDVVVIFGLLTMNDPR